MDFFKKETRTALQAIEYAQWIAHAPMVFQASRILRDSGILKAALDAGKAGITLEEIVEKVKLPHYGVRVLLESGLGIGLLLVNDDKYTLTKTGHFILNDAMTRANMDFSQDVCYEAMFYLEDSIKEEKPVGLKVFGDKWKTVYEALSELPPKVQKSWFGFDHFYSDDAFPLVLPLVFKNKPKKLMDIGGNTGKWSIACAKYNPDVQITIVDLPGQLNMAKANIASHGLSDRITFHGANMLDENLKLPAGHDAIWMSQFLDCFSEKEITSILTRCHEAVAENGFVYILEPFWDRQRFEAAAFSLQQTSLYFTAIANGNSQMYDSRVFVKCIEAAGFEIAEQIDQIGVSQTLMKLKKK
ncbi:MAG TPA: methyltransferase [Bacteroidia bacterium]|jgi:ubiquinone/menaquinone biosynthesis C-methylase UbiE